MGWPFPEQSRLSGFSLVRLCRVGAKKVAPVPEWMLEDREMALQVQARGRWFVRCDDVENLEWYKKDYADQARVLSITLPAHIAERYRVANLAAEAGIDPRAYSRRPEEEYFLPRAFANRAK